MLASATPPRPPQRLILMVSSGLSPPRPWVLLGTSPPSAHRPHGASSDLLPCWCHSLAFGVVGEGALWPPLLDDLTSVLSPSHSVSAASPAGPPVPSFRSHLMGPGHLPPPLCAPPASPPSHRSPHPSLQAERGCRAAEGPGLNPSASVARRCGFSLPVPQFLELTYCALAVASPASPAGRPPREVH